MADSKRTERNYWPHFIVGLVLFAAVLGVWTIKAAMDNPVELDNSYMLDYHNADEEINEILKKQRVFDKKYRVDLKERKISAGENILTILVTDINGSMVKNADVTVLVTRPETTKLDKKLKARKTSQGYQIKVDLEKEGRWNFVVKTEIEEAQGFKTFKLSTLE